MTEANRALTIATPGVMIERHELNLNQEQIELVKRTVAPGLNNDEFSLFMYVAKSQNLDPLRKQVHCVKRKTWAGTNPDGSDKYEERMTIQTGIDGYRAIANRTGLYMPSEKEARIEGEGTPNLKATVYVLKFSPHDKQWHEFSATAYYREYVQTKRVKDGNQWKVKPVAMWEKMPINQLCKCAEALALRKGWPEELGMIYTDDEMQQADSHVVEVIPPQKQADDPQQRTSQNKTKDVATLEPGKEQNRGHGNEGMQKASVSTSKAQKAPQAAVNASEGQSEKKSDVATKPKEMRGWLCVLRVSPKLKKPDAKAIAKAKQEGKPEPEPKPYFELKCEDNSGHEAWVYVWHATLCKHAPRMLNKWCDVGLSQQQKNDKTFWSLETLYEIEGYAKFVDNEPAVEGGITREDVKQTTGVVLDGDEIFPESQE